MFQIHLNKRGCSGRGVRYRILKPSEIDHIEREAGKSLDDNDRVSDYIQVVTHMGMVAMVSAYTEPNQKEVNGTSKWKDVDKGELDLKWGEIFSTKDTAILKLIYNQEHGTSRAEVEDILKGKVDVLEA